MIHFYNVHMQYGGYTALRDISINVEKGEFVFITGPSGAGKTSLLRLIFGMERPSSGQLLVNSINLNRIKRNALDMLRRKMGFIFQDFKLLNSRTVFENVAIALQIAGERPSYIRQKTKRVLKHVGLEGKEQNYPMQLSGGEQQRVAIARAIVNDPMLIIADEPTGNLDDDRTKEIMALFQTIHLKGTTVVVATHNHDLLQKTAFRNIVLNEGRLVKA